MGSLVQGPPCAHHGAFKFSTFFFFLLDYFMGKAHLPSFRLQILPCAALADKPCLSCHHLMVLPDKTDNFIIALTSLSTLKFPRLSSRSLCASAKVILS